jgi:hypothetical protein
MLREEGLQCLQRPETRPIHLLHNLVVIAGLDAKMIDSLTVGVQKILVNGFSPRGLNELDSMDPPYRPCLREDGADRVHPYTNSYREPNQRSA